MTGSLRTVEVACPYCGEGFETLLDSPESSMRYIEDCQVCCQPIEFTVVLENEEIRLEARRDDD